MSDVLDTAIILQLQCPFLPQVEDQKIAEHQVHQDLLFAPRRCRAQLASERIRSKALAICDTRKKARDQEMSCAPQRSSGGIALLAALTMCFQWASCHLEAPEHRRNSMSYPFTSKTSTSNFGGDLFRS